MHEAPARYRTAFAAAGRHAVYERNRYNMTIRNQE